jgi:hypothetical protein
MRFLQTWWRTVIFSIQHNPPQFIEYLMVSSAVGLAMRRFFTPEWPYLVLSASLAIGAAVSMWVRELMVPSPHSCVFKLLGVSLLIYSLYTFADLAPYL